MSDNIAKIAGPAADVAAAAPEDRGEAPDRRRWLILAVALAQLMAVLDATIVNIALPSAQRALHFFNADRQWVITAYALASGSLLLLGGNHSDRGRESQQAIRGEAGGRRPGFVVQPSIVTGFLGPNGAGKSATQAFGDRPGCAGHGYLDCGV